MIPDNQSSHERTKIDEKISQMFHRLIAYEHGQIDFLTLLDQWEQILGIMPQLRDHKSTKKEGM